MMIMMIIIIITVLQRSLVKEPHCKRSARPIWHALSKKFTVLPAHPRVYPRMNHTCLFLPSGSWSSFTDPVHERLSWPKTTTETGVRKLTTSRAASRNAKHCARGGDYRGDGGTRPPNILVGEEVKGFCIFKIQFLFSFRGGGLRPLTP